MKKLIIWGIALFFLIGCAGVGIKLSDNAITVLQQSATSTVGYMISKNNPKYIPDMIKWYTMFKKVQDLNTAQSTFKDGMAQLSTLVSDDSYLQLQIRNAMNLLEIDTKGPQTEIDMGRYQAIVDAFMSGVYAAQNI